MPSRRERPAPAAAAGAYQGAPHPPVSEFQGPMKKRRRTRFGPDSRPGAGACTAPPWQPRKCLRRRTWPVIIKNRARRPGKFNWEVSRGSEDPICRAQRPALFLPISQRNATRFCAFRKKKYSIWCFCTHVTHSSVHIRDAESDLPDTGYAAIGAGGPGVWRGARAVARIAPRPTIPSRTDTRLGVGFGNPRDRAWPIPRPPRSLRRPPR